MAEDNSWNYLLDWYNWVDMAYLLMSGMLIIVTIFGDDANIDVALQRTIAAFSTMFLWLKVIDWMRLFSKTAFYVHLIIQTIIDTMPFMIVMGVWFMTFGTSFFLLDYNRQSDEGEIVQSVFSFWAMNAFLNQY